MGLCGFLGSKSTYDTEPRYVPLAPNPNPNNYKILRCEQIGKYLVLELQYPDCTNYEGKKILLFKDIKLMDLVNQGSIDPHFSNNDAYHSPIARFAPTEAGWEMAVFTAKYKDKERQIAERL